MVTECKFQIKEVDPESFHVECATCGFTVICQKEKNRVGGTFACSLPLCLTELKTTESREWKIGKAADGIT